MTTYVHWVPVLVFTTVTAACKSDSLPVYPGADGSGVGGVANDAAAASGSGGANRATDASTGGMTGSGSSGVDGNAGASGGAGGGGWGGASGGSGGLADAASADAPAPDAPFAGAGGAAGESGAAGSTGTGGTTTATAGTTSAGGAPGRGGSGGPGSDGVLCPPTKNGLITDFTYAPVDGGATTDFVHFGDATTLSGGESLYPISGSYPMAADVTQSDWHISGVVGDYSGFALYFEACSRIDASVYRGISFAIAGSVPQGNVITMGIGTLNNTPTGAWLLEHGKTSAMTTDPGRCIPTSGNQYYHPGCTDSTAVIPVTPTPTVQKILWSDFTGGAPEASVNPSGILSIYWFLPWSGDGSTPYAVDLVLDDIAFFP